MVLDKIQSFGYIYNQNFAKRYPNPLVHGPGPMYKHLIPDWNKFEYKVHRWTAIPSMQDERWSLDIPYWELKEGSKLIKFVKAMKPKFKLKVCPIQVKTDKCIFTGITLKDHKEEATKKIRTRRYTRGPGGEWVPGEWQYDDCGQQ